MGINSHLYSVIHAVDMCKGWTESPLIVSSHSFKEWPAVPSLLKETVDRVAEEWGTEQKDSSCRAKSLFDLAPYFIKALPSLIVKMHH